MKKLIKKLFRNDIIRNERGSSLSITLIVITVLTFSITAITKTTVNLSSSTSIDIAAVNDESVAKGLITQAISEFEAYILATNSYVDFNNVEILRIKNDYNVDVTDETDNLSDFGDSNGYLTKAYKFSFTLSNDDTINKFAYMSNNGSSLNTYYPFEYGIGTEGDLILNGGYYDEVMMFANNIRVTKTSPWYEYYYEQDHYLTPEVSGVFPTFTNNGDASKIFYGESYTYCTSNCYTVTQDGSNPYVLETSNFQNVEGGSLSDTGDIQTDKVTSFFGDFDYEAFLVDYAANILPTDNKKITDTITLANFEQVIRDNMAPQTKVGKKWTLPNTPYVDVTNDTNYKFDKSNERFKHAAVYDGDVEFNRNVQFDDFDDEGFIVLGDLTINNNQSNKTTKIKGTYIVTGDLLLTGYSSNFDRATFIVFGEVKVDYTYGYGMRTNGKNYELAFIAKDNIIFDNVWENYTTSSPPLVTMLAYTEESIFMDLVESKMRIEGALFARALGNSTNPIFMEYDTGEQVNGIVINSYRGYVNYSWQWDNGWKRLPSYIPNTNDNANRFYQYQVKYSDFQKNFMNIPEFEGVVVSDGEYTLETSEWFKE